MKHLSNSPGREFMIVCLIALLGSTITPPPIEGRASGVVAVAHSPDSDFMSSALQQRVGNERKMGGREQHQAEVGACGQLSL